MCTVCCESYIPNGKACSACAEKQCLAEEKKANSLPANTTAGEAGEVGEFGEAGGQKDAPEETGTGTGWITAVLVVRDQSESPLLRLHLLRLRVSVFCHVWCLPVTRCLHARMLCEACLAK